MARAGVGSACRTSCRSARGTARAAPWWPGCGRAGRSDRACRSSRDRARTPSRAGRDPRWSGKSGGRPPDGDPPGNCRAAARGPRGRRRPRRSASSAARPTAARRAPRAAAPRRAGRAGAGSATGPARARGARGPREGTAMNQSLPGAPCRHHAGDHGQRHCAPHASDRRWARSRLELDFTCAAETHSSSRRRVTRRHRVRSTASPISQA